MGRGSWLHKTSIEYKFAELAARRGWAAHRAGWPDFFLTQDEEFWAVEVKSSTDTIRPEQRRMFGALEKAGIRVMVWWEAAPERLIPWRAFDKTQRKNRAEYLKERRLAQKVRNGQAPLKPLPPKGFIGVATQAARTAASPEWRRVMKRIDQHLRSAR